MYVTYNSFVQLICIQGEISDTHWNLSETLTLGFFEDYGTERDQTWYAYNHYVALHTDTFVGDLWPW